VPSDDQEFLELSGINSHSSPRTILSEDAFPILRGLSPLSLRILNDSSRLTHVSKGVELLHEGDKPHDLCFIKSGNVSIVKKSTGKLKVLTQMGQSEVFGEYGILRKKTRYASVFTTEASDIIRIELSAIEQVLDADPRFNERLNKLLNQRMLDSFFFSHPIFSNMSHDTRIELTKELKVHTYGHNTRLFTQGEKPTGVYLILSGEVEVHYLNHNRDEILLEIRRDNDLIGELAAKNGTSLAYSAISASDVDTLHLDARTMKLMRDHHPATFNILQQYINKRAEKTAERLKASTR